MPSTNSWSSRGFLLFLLLCLVQSLAVKDKKFKHDYHAQDDESSETFRLRSEGKLADVVNLDDIRVLKRVACVEDRLMMLMDDITVAKTWRQGQVVIGGPQWGCNATREQPKASGIYVKIQSIFFPLERQVTIHHKPAGPFDMIEEADIHFHYRPAKKARKHGGPVDRSRLRRALPNLMSNILNNIDWHANFTTDIPLYTGSTRDGQRLALHKKWGQSELSLSRGQETGHSYEDDDFVLAMDQLKGHTKLAYTFNLVIKNNGGNAVVADYESQFDLESEFCADSTITFSREMGLTYVDVPVFNTPATELFRVPVASVPDVPPVFLTLGYRADTLATVKTYTARATSLRTAFNASGSTTISQRNDPVFKARSDVSSRDWLIEPEEQSLKSSSTVHLDFSVYQKLYFMPAVSWHFHDVDIELSPPVEVTIRPEVHLKSSNPGVAQCVESDAKVDAYVLVHNAYFSADAFGLSLWNVLLEPSKTHDIHLVNLSLGQECEARCYGPEELVSSLLNTTLTSASAFSRNDLQFKSLITLNGDVVVVQDGGSEITWCGHQNSTCYSCDFHSVDTQPQHSCAARLMTSRLAAVLTLLSEFVSVEWPNNIRIVHGYVYTVKSSASGRTGTICYLEQLLVLESWDEPTSSFPLGRHGVSSIFAEGRAASVTLIERNNASSSTDKSASSLSSITSIIQRLSQLAVCAGADDVRTTPSKNLLEIAVEKNGFEMSSSSNSVDEENGASFMKSMESLSVSNLADICSQAPQLSPGNQWPQGISLEEGCGPTDRPLNRANRRHMKQLVHWNLTDIPVTFEPEGLSSQWCSYQTRQCHDCSQPSMSLEPWDWCSTRMMTPRLLVRLRKLQILAKMQNISLHVLLSFQEPTEKQMNVLPLLFTEGRGIRLSTFPSGRETTLASLAVCAGFDFVSFDDPTYIEAFVKKQSGFQASLVSFLEGPLRPAVVSDEPDVLEYGYPDELAEEAVLSALVDGHFASSVYISEHVLVKDVMSYDGRYFRLDPALLECVELVKMDYSGKFEILKGSAYRTRSANFQQNIDLRHIQEIWRFQAGQALQLSSIPSSTQDLLALAMSLLRECPPVIRLGMRGMGLGCHADHIYIDFRPLIPGFERYYVTVWEAENISYCQDVRKLQREMIEGGPVVQALPATTCKDRGLKPGLEFLSFQFGQNAHCNVDGQEEFCMASREARDKAADSLQVLLTSAAGYGRLPRFELIDNIKACLVDLCGGCPGSGQVFDTKVRACSQMVHRYIERAASPFPELVDVATFFNMDTALSTVQAIACQNGSVCIEDTPVYSLFVPTVTARYYPDPSRSLERALFSSDINPTPILEIISQEVAYAAKGKVRVFIEAEKDIYALRNVLKVLMVYNKNVTLVEFVLASSADPDLVASAIHRKLEAWSGVACPLYSRFAMSPFIVVAMDAERHKRSADLSMSRNIAKSKIYNWELEWLEKLY